MSKFIQQVTCATRDGRTLDHCYTTIKVAYRSIPRAPLGSSDHAMVYLVPTYKQQLKRVKPTVKTVNAMETLRGCFECALIGECSKTPQPTFTNTPRKSAMQSCQIELSVMREISLLQYVKRGRNVCKTRSALPEVAKQPRMLGGPGPPSILGCFATSGKALRVHGHFFY